MNRKLMEKLGLNPADFEPCEEQATISDVVEALNLLTSIVLEGQTDD